MELQSFALAADRPSVVAFHDSLAAIFLARSEALFTRESWPGYPSATIEAALRELRSHGLTQLG